MPSVNTELLQPLIKLYIQLGGGVLLGWVLGRLLPKRVPTLIGQFSVSGLAYPSVLLLFCGVRTYPEQFGLRQ
jgi:hypothetical protein